MERETKSRAGGSAAAARSGLAFGVSLLVLGLVVAMIGATLSGLCLVEGGVVCSGTPLSSMGSTALVIGAAALSAGVLLVQLARKRVREADRTRSVERPDRTRSAFFQELQGEAAIARAAAAPPGAAKPVSPDCPRCNGPVKPGETACEWCGAALQWDTSESG